MTINCTPAAPTCEPTTAALSAGLEATRIINAAIRRMTSGQPVDSHTLALDVANAIDRESALPQFITSARLLIDWYESTAPDVQGGPHQAYELSKAAIEKLEGRS